MSMCVSDATRRKILLFAGVKLSKDGKAIFNYNPGIFQTGLNWLLAFPFLPTFLNRGHLIQLLGLYAVLDVYWLFLADSPGGGETGQYNQQVIMCYNNLSLLSRFVLGLFVSLVLSKTYYANRGMFGTVFGCSMGLAQMTVSWVKPPPSLSGDMAAQACAKTARCLIIRWINAAFRLMWLEAVPGKSASAICEAMMKADLLTQKEWAKIEGLSSRCTHVYQWMNNVIDDLFRKGYIVSGHQLATMSAQVDNMRAANVWGLPSLPIAYTQLITHMVKMHLLLLALNNGAMANIQERSGDHACLPIVVLHIDLALHNYLYQGLLDLHGALYNPNAGIYLGHLPAINFMDFVHNVTTHLESENDSLPYELKLVEGPVDKMPVDSVPLDRL